VSAQLAVEVTAALISARCLEACGKLPSCLPVPPDLLDVQPKGVGVGEHLLDHEDGFAHAARAGEQLRLAQLQADNVPSSPRSPSGAPTTL
jgi:hypothetical protein